MNDQGKRAQGESGAGAVEGEADEAPHRPALRVTFRISAALAERLDRLAAELSTPWHEMNRSELARAAVERGLDAIERAAASAQTAGAAPADAAADDENDAEKTGDDPVRCGPRG